MTAAALNNHPLPSGKPPAWAHSWGQDRYGVFVDVVVGRVAQRLRWIPPGTFRMGSPESETGRFEWEGPRHEVGLSEGFWLADTPCTQELWQAVTGDNPSRFRGTRRPVEQVSWDDCQRFLETLNARQAGLEMRLPTEAQWEYACRAGTRTATWAGNLEILGERNAPLLDDIAWYGGNSGVDYDLDRSVESSHWREKQHPHKRTGSRKVGQKRPNPWGLYDILGNVYEWCLDTASDRFPKGLQTTPAGPEQDVERVIRGGSWGEHACRVRAAYRYWNPPGFRNAGVGLRLARGP